MVIFLGASKYPLGIIYPCTTSDGIRPKVFPECIDRSSKLKQFTPGFAKKIDLVAD